MPTITKPQITDDTEAGAIYVKIRSAKIDHTDIYGRVAVDVGFDGDVVGVEILYKKDE